MSHRVCLGLAAILFLVIPVSAQLVTGTTTTVTSGDGKFHSTRSCSSCHVPHAAAGDNSQVPLWNPEHETTTLQASYYTGSESLNADTSTGPNGASRMCLSCHDGSYSAVSTFHRFGPSNTQGSLVNSHPVSIVYDAALVVADGEL